MRKKDIKKLIKIQRYWKNILAFRNDIVEELKLFRKITEKIMINLELSYKNEIFSLSDYKKSIELLQYTYELLSNYPEKLTVRYMNKFSKFNILSNLARMKLSLIEIITLVGQCSIDDTIRLFGCNLKEVSCYSDVFKLYLDYLEDYFKIIKVEYYNSENENNLSFKINTYGKSTKKTSSIVLTSSQLNKPSIQKYNNFSKNLKVKVNGCRVYLPLDNKLIILYGYFENDQLNSYQSKSIFKDKFNKVDAIFENIDINETYKDNFLETLSIKEFSVHTSVQLANNCMGHYNDLVKFKNKNISQMVKEFVLTDIEKQRYIIYNLLLDTDDENSGYIANLLLDLIVSDSQNVFPKTADIILDTLHWNLKKIYKTNQEIVDNINNKLANYNENTIPYEKRIHLMKTTDYVKSKAIDKLKELNSSKNGESNAKAQQYLDGLLKIPFGIYKNESIKIRLDEVNDKITKINASIIREINQLEENNTLNDYDLNNTANLQELLFNFNKNKKNPLNISKYTRNIKNWLLSLMTNKFSLSQCYIVDVIRLGLKKIKVPELKELCNNLSLKTSGKKDHLINNILDKKYTKGELETFKNFSNLDKNIFQSSKFCILIQTNEFLNIVGYIEQIDNLYQKYSTLQKDYFKDVNNTLDNAVYGLDNAKKQITRLLAQWINGENQGYVFGFEGPPGTGKTTLAKKGIAKCLKDEFNEDRPFVFIALGGSSNGSTLEGHNYTYVGSQWGRIIEGIINSKCMNPIIYIDELDKISRTEHGKEIVGILTHLTDPSQNQEFTDKYFSGIQFDISKCLIIFSYNDPNLIDRILLDRIQRVRIEPLSKIDKIMVSTKHILPEILENVGFTDSDITISEDALIYLIDTYTYEAGARKLKEKLYELYREVNIKYLQTGNEILPFNIDKKFIDKIFDGYPKHEIVKIHDKPRPGLVNGLFATAAGIGGITIIETYKFVSSTHLEFKLTGMQGDVMKESMNVAKTLALNLVPDEVLEKLQNPDDKDKFGIHIHCPAGATPKDGPSAGTAITVAIISLLCNIPVRNDYGITGEIDLNGNVLPIGGLESKSDGAKSAGVLNVFCPRKNTVELERIRKRKNPPEDDTFKITMIDSIYDALEYFLIMPNNTNVKDYFKSL
jgi:endopeptidase La